MTCGHRGLGLFGVEVIGVGEGQAKSVGQQGADGRLTATGDTHDHNMAKAQVIVAFHI